MENLANKTRRRVKFWSIFKFHKSKEKEINFSEKVKIARKAKEEELNIIKTGKCEIKI